MIVHFAAFATEYEALTARAQQHVVGFPPLLRDLALSLLPQLGAGSFSPIVALLPYWVADLLAQQRAPANPTSLPADTQTLGLANLLGWWSYLIQDWLLDREPGRPELLPVGMAFYAAAVRLFQDLLPGDAAFWAAFETLSLVSAEAHCWEQRRHFQTLADIDDEALDFGDLDRLADRSALLQLTTVAQLALRGYGRDDPLYEALSDMLRHYAIARQIGDDRADWVDDLQRGRLNYVSACILRRMKETGAVQDCVGLDVERVVGYFLCDDELFAAIQRTALAACKRAAQSIAPYDPQYLGALIDDLYERIESDYQAALGSRRDLQDLFQKSKNFTG